MKIEDGTGTGLLSRVDSNNHLEVSSTVSSESHFIALKKAQTYIWTSSYSTSTGDEVIYIMNTSKTKVLVVDKVTVNSVLTGLFELCTVTGTASGTTITGANTNLTSGNVAAATSLGDAAVTGVSSATRVDMARVSATGRATMELNDVLILGFNDAITITYTGSTSITDTIITGYYLDN